MDTCLTERSIQVEGSVGLWTGKAIRQSMNSMESQNDMCVDVPLLGNSPCVEDSASGECMNSNPILHNGVASTAADLSNVTSSIHKTTTIDKNNSNANDKDEIEDRNDGCLSINDSSSNVEANLTPHSGNCLEHDSVGKIDSSLDCGASKDSYHDDKRLSVNTSKTPFHTESSKSIASVNERQTVPESESSDGKLVMKVASTDIPDRLCECESPGIKTENRDTHVQPENPVTCDNGCQGEVTVAKDSVSRVERTKQDNGDSLDKSKPNSPIPALNNVALPLDMDNQCDIMIKKNMDSGSSSEIHLKEMENKQMDILKTKMIEKEEVVELKKKEMDLDGEEDKTSSTTVSEANKTCEDIKNDIPKTQCDAIDVNAKSVLENEVESKLNFSVRGKSVSLLKSDFLGAASMSVQQKDNSSQLTEVECKSLKEKVHSGAVPKTCVHKGASDLVKIGSEKQNVHDISEICMEDHKEVREREPSSVVLGDNDGDTSRQKEVVGNGQNIETSGKSGTEGNQGSVSNIDLLNSDSLIVHDDVKEIEIRSAPASNVSDGIVRTSTCHTTMEPGIPSQQVLSNSEESNVKDRSSLTKCLNKMDTNLLLKDQGSSNGQSGSLIVKKDEMRDSSQKPMMNSSDKEIKEDSQSCLKNSSDREMKEDSQNSLFNSSDREMKEDSQKSLFNSSDKEMKEDSQKSLFNSSDKEMKEDSQKCMLNSSDKDMKEGSQKCMVNSSEGEMKEDSQKSLVNSSNLEMKEDGHKSLLNSSDKEIKEDGQKSLVNSSDKEMKEDGHKSLLNTCDKEIKEDDQKSLVNSSDKEMKEVGHKSLLNTCDKEMKEDDQKFLVNSSDIEMKEDSKKFLVNSSDKEIKEDDQKSLVNSSDKEMKEDGHKSLLNTCDKEMKEDDQKSLVNSSDIEMKEDIKKSLVNSSDKEMKEDGHKSLLNSCDKGIKEDDQKFLVNSNDKEMEEDSKKSFVNSSDKEVKEDGQKLLVNSSDIDMKGDGKKSLVNSSKDEGKTIDKNLDNDIVFVDESCEIQPAAASGSASFKDIPKGGETPKPMATVETDSIVIDDLEMETSESETLKDKSIENKTSGSKAVSDQTEQQNPIPAEKGASMENGSSVINNSKIGTENGRKRSLLEDETVSNDSSKRSKPNPVTDKPCNYAEKKPQEGCNAGGADSDDDVIVGKVETREPSKAGINSVQLSCKVLQDFIKACVGTFMKRNKQERIEKLNEQAERMQSATALWKETARHLEVSVVEFTKLNQKLEKRKLHSNTTKNVSSRTVGIQVNEENQTGTIHSNPGAKSPISTLPSANLTLPPSVLLNPPAQQNASGFPHKHQQAPSPSVVNRPSFHRNSGQRARLPSQSSVPANIPSTPTQQSAAVTGNQPSNQNPRKATIQPTTPSNLIDLTDEEDNSRKKTFSSTAFRSPQTSVTNSPRYSSGQSMSTAVAAPLNGLAQQNVVKLRGAPPTSTQPPGLLLSTGNQLLSTSAVTSQNPLLTPGGGLVATPGSQYLVPLPGATGGIRPGTMFALVQGNPPPPYPGMTTNPSAITTQQGQSGNTKSTTAISTKAAVPKTTHSLPPSVHINQHPAPLPVAPKALSVPAQALKVPPKPGLKISRVAQGIVLSWNMPPLAGVEVISSYQLFAYQETDSALPNSTLWKKVGDVKALPLPMACTLTQFQEGNKYHFAVRAVDQYGRYGVYSDPSTIYLGPKP